MTTNEQASVAPVKILIAAMGGQGGGTLTHWIINAARKKNLPVQATSVPGVAQRSGATTYYIEIFPTPFSALNDQQVIFDLYPTPGDVDLMIATELVEASRAIKKGYVSSDKTILLASTNRIYSLEEKMKMGDGRYESEAALKTAKQFAKQTILFDMESAALEAGCVINSVILGALAGTGVLPITADDFEDGIKQEGKAVQSNLAGFYSGMAYADGKTDEEIDPAVATQAATASRLKGSANSLILRIKRDFDHELQPIVLEAAERCLDFQDTAYAQLFLDRLDSIHKQNDADTDLVWETARYLGQRMAYEDVFRVAQLKSRTSRIKRLTHEVGVNPNQLLRVTEFLKPGLEEMAQILPRNIGRRIMKWAEANPEKARNFHFGLHLRTDTILGYLRIRTLAGLRRFRRIGYRFAEEQSAIENWLGLVRSATGSDLELAREVVECARLIKGYGSTHQRGTDNFTQITNRLIKPSIESAQFKATDIARAREAALNNSTNDTLSTLLDQMTGPCAGSV